MGHAPHQLLPSWRLSKGDLAYRAMALARLGRTDEARVWLDRAQGLANEADRIESVPTAWGDTRWLDWNERTRVKALLTEARSLIGAD